MPFILYVFLYPVCTLGPYEHVRAGDLGGGDDTALVLSGSHDGSKQAAAQESGGEFPKSGIGWFKKKTRLSFYTTVAIICCHRALSFKVYLSL